MARELPSRFRILVGVFALALSIRWLSPLGPPPTAPFADAGHDPATGALLLDLDDDLAGESGGLRARLARMIDAAVAPAPWPTGGEAFGRLLSRGAQLYRLRVPASEVEDVLGALRGADGVEGVERERIWHIPEASLSATPVAVRPDGARRGSSGGFRPDDPYYVHQWHLDQIQMPSAWERSRGAGVVVAVVDTGVLYRDHGRARRAPDLAQTRFVPGWDFVDGDDGPDDEHGHGTHVAGTVAQSTNNGVGVAGVAPAAAIMPVRVLDADGAGSWGAVASGIRFAAEHGADVINLSLGGASRSRTIQRAIDFAHGRGVVVVAAAGNTGRGKVEFPAAGRHVISVGAVRFDRELAFYSSFGPGLDVVAPGGDLRVDQNHDGLPDGVLQNTMLRGDPSRHDYLALQGTSMAAPHVAGVAALLRAQGVRRPGAIEGILERSATDLGDGEHFGAGLVSADDALIAATSGLGGLRGGLALALGALLLAPLARRRRLDVAWAPTLGLAFVCAGGLAVLPWASVGLGWVSGPLAAPASALLGGAAPAAALLPLALVALGLSRARVRTSAVGIAVGLGGTFLVEVAAPTALPLPAHLGLLAALTAAAFSLSLASMAATRGRVGTDRAGA